MHRERAACSEVCEAKGHLGSLLGSGILVGSLGCVAGVWCFGGCLGV